jgi:hypothetical protein
VECTPEALEEFRLAFFTDSYARVLDSNHQVDGSATPPFGARGRVDVKRFLVLAEVYDVWRIRGGPFNGATHRHHDLAFSIFSCCEFDGIGDQIHQN